MTSIKVIEEMLFTNPLSLLAIRDKQVINQINNLVPYSTGFDIECHEADNYDESCFTNIPDIMDVNNGCGEQRYRIPNGLVGIICLYNICYQLKVNSLLNPLSSIHYHIDCTDCFNEISKLIRDNKENQEYILSELDKWLAKDEIPEVASSRKCGFGSWFKLNDLRTIEYRMGEMTFEYGLILKRVIHCNAITKYFKDKVEDRTKVAIPTFIEPNIQALKNYFLIRDTNLGIKTYSLELQEIERKLAELNATPITPQEQIQVRKRKHIL